MDGKDPKKNNKSKISAEPEDVKVGEEKAFSDLNNSVLESLEEIDQKYTEPEQTNETPITEGVILKPKDGLLPGEEERELATDPQEPPAPVEGFGSVKIDVPDLEAGEIGAAVDSQIENKEMFQQKQKPKAEADIISTVEETPDRYEGVSIKEEFKEKELMVTPRKRKAVRTYRDFAIENAKSGGGSLATMIMAEREKDGERSRKSAKNPKNIMMSVLSIALVVLGIGGVVAAYFVAVSKQEDIKEANSIIITPNPQITAEFSKEIYEPDINIRKLTDGFENDYDGTVTPIGSIKQVYFTTSSGESLKYLVNTKKFLEILNTRTPSALLRTFEEDFTLGIYSTIENSQFLIFKVGSYPSAVEGMLDWENEIVLDLNPVMGIDQVEQVRKRFFEDIIIFNKDTRAILDTEGNIAFAYSFIDRQTLIIFKDKNTLKEVVSRLQNTIKR